ncbi:TPA: hypothetical protein HA238_04610 [Candidatus Micrarchaeota archaeon]|nr:hypothetical protein [Candidatus Micrarchaeota archaeon]
MADVKNVLLVVFGIIIFLVAGYAVYMYALPSLQKHDGEGEGENSAGNALEIYEKSLLVGQGATNYGYIYDETLDEYVMRTILRKNGAVRQVTVETPISERNIYFTENDTIMCVEYEDEYACSSVKNTTAPLSKYLKVVGGQFFSKEKIDSAKETFEFLKQKDAITFEEVVETIENNEKCSEVNFVIDYSNLTLSEAMSLNVRQGDPKRYEAKLCFSEERNEVISKEFAYNYLGKDRISKWDLVSSNWKYNEEIIVPENLTAGKAITLLQAASDDQNAFIACLEKEGIEHDKCVYSMALDKKNLELCKFAGGRKDICILNLAIMAKDTEMCKLVTESGIKDDCYIELGGTMKNASICGSILNSTKVSMCEEFATTNKTTIKQSNESLEIPEKEADWQNISEYDKKKMEEILGKAEADK